MIYHFKLCRVSRGKKPEVCLFNTMRNQHGFTLIELLVVMIIIGLLAALVGPRFIRQEEKAKVKAAKAQIELLGTALDTFRLDVGRYPTSQEGLEALMRQPGGLERWDGPYLRKDLPQDPWGSSLRLPQSRRAWPI